MSADTIKHYKIKKIIRVEKNGINIINAIEVLSNNSSNNKDNNNPLPNVGNKAKNNFKDYADNKEGNNLNAMFFWTYIRIYISNISNIDILLIKN